MDRQALAEVGASSALDAVYHTSRALGLTAHGTWERFGVERQSAYTAVALAVLRGDDVAAHAAWLTARAQSFSPPDPRLFALFVAVVRAVAVASEGGA